MHIDSQNEFINLYKSLELTNCENQFILDGIINPSLYASQNVKIIFIAKEHNKLEKEYTGEASHSAWWNDHVKYAFSHRIGEWAYGVLNNFPDYNKAQDYSGKHRALKSIAFINVKKVCGGSSADYKIMYEYIHKSKHLIQRQILDIAPKHIICCFRDDWYVEELFVTKNLSPTPKSWGFSVWNGIKIINYFHPSSRKNKESLYNGLRDALHFADTYSL